MILKNGKKHSIATRYMVVFSFVAMLILSAGYLVSSYEHYRGVILPAVIVAIFGAGLLLHRRFSLQAALNVGKQLQDANDFLKKVMEGSTNALVVLDLAGNIQMFNGRFEALSGCSREELMGHHFCRLFSGDALAQVSDELLKISAEKEKNITFETLLSRRDGLELNLFCGAVPLINDGTISGVIVSLDDITERISAEEDRLELERRFQQTQKLESLGVLAGGIAHDFNNILTIILGYCFAIRDDIDSASAHAEYVRKIEDAANRAGELCRQMLSYAGRNELKHSPVNMNSLVDEMVAMLQAGIKKNVTIELDKCEDQEIVADGSQIQQIVMNLIINAAEAIGDENGLIRISLTKAEVAASNPESDFTGMAITAGRYLCLEVSDTGCGMDKKTQNRVFEPFFTTKFAGRGLGMSATLGIIKSHDGALQLSSKPGGGTTFKVYLPLQELTDPSELKPAFGQSAVAREGGTILLVDDEEELRLLGPIRLEKIGYTTITAADGLEALEIFREHREIDLVILDILMPVMGGFETYHHLREISMTIPIVFCSGCSKKELSADIHADEHTAFLRKPYKPEQLRNVLLEMLG